MPTFETVWPLALVVLEWLAPLISVIMTIGIVIFLLRLVIRSFVD